MTEIQLGSLVFLPTEAGPHVRVVVRGGKAIRGSRPMCGVFTASAEEWASLAVVATALASFADLAKLVEELQARVAELEHLLALEQQTHRDNVTELEQQLAPQLTKEG